MLSPRNAQIIAVLLTTSFLFGTPFTAARAQDPPPPPPGLKPTVKAENQKPDYSQEAVVIEQLSTNYRY
jgi:hypothetical protein